jgi:hypothetical protein
VARPHRIVEVKDWLEWREWLPLDLGRGCTLARGRSAVASAGRRALPWRRRGSPPQGRGSAPGLPWSF